MKKLNKRVIINIDGLGVNLNSSDNFNIFKYTDLDLFKKNINIQNINHLIKMPASDKPFELSFSEVFHVKEDEQSYRKKYYSLNFREQLLNIPAGNSIELFLYINENDVKNHDLEIQGIFESLINIYQKDKKLVGLNLIVESPIFYFDNLKEMVSAFLEINKNYFYINSIAISQGLIDTNFDVDFSKKYLNFLFKNDNDDQSKTFNNVANIIINNKIYKEFYFKNRNSFFSANKSVVIIDIYQSRLKKIFDIFSSDELKFNKDYFLFDENNFNINLYYEDNDLSKNIKNNYPKNHLILNASNDYSLKLFPFSNHSFINVKYFDNEFDYIYKKANAFFEELKIKIKEKNLVILDWDILKESYELFDWDKIIYAVAVFNLFIFKITHYLNTHNIKWLIFSKNNGLEHAFQNQKDKPINSLMISSKIYADSFIYNKDFTLNDLKTCTDLFVSKPKVELMDQDNQEQKKNISNSKKFSQLIAKHEKKLKTIIETKDINKILNEKKNFKKVLEFPKTKYFNFDRKFDFENNVSVIKKAVSQTINPIYRFLDEETKIFNYIANKHVNNEESLYLIINFFETYQDVIIKYNKFLNIKNYSVSYYSHFAKMNEFIKRIKITSNSIEFQIENIISEFLISFNTFLNNLKQFMLDLTKDLKQEEKLYLDEMKRIKQEILIKSKLNTEIEYLTSIIELKDNYELTQEFDIQRNTEIIEVK